MRGKHARVVLRLFSVDYRPGWWTWLAPKWIGVVFVFCLDDRLYIRVVKLRLFVYGRLVGWLDRRRHSLDKRTLYEEWKWKFRRRFVGFFFFAYLFRVYELCLLSRLLWLVFPLGLSWILAFWFSMSFWFQNRVFFFLYVFLDFRNVCIQCKCRFFRSLVHNLSERMSSNKRLLSKVVAIFCIQIYPNFFLGWILNNVCEMVGVSKCRTKFQKKNEHTKRKITVARHLKIN